jgi:ABC-type branched-subunit amino acid transport system ATPase component
MLQVEGLNVYYGKSHAVQDTSFHVGAGEVVALLGRNGAGKTTSCNGVMGLRPGTRGKVVVDGTDVSKAMPHRRVRHGLAYVPQGRLLFDGLTVEDNLRAVWDGKDQSVWDSLMELFPRVGERLSQRAGTLSGGEQQMVAVARAMLTRPKVLILDEPTTGLMPSVVDRLKAAVSLWRSQGMGVLLIEEQIPFALDAADRVYLMDVGRIVHEGASSDLRNGELLKRYLGVGL